MIQQKVLELALEKIKADEKTTRPPTPEERAILNSYRRKA